MTLKDMLIKEGLFTYIEGHAKKLVNLKLDSYSKIEGGYIVCVGMNEYRVMAYPYRSSGEVEYVYNGSKRTSSDESFTPIPLSTRSDEDKYPKLLSWIGTALCAYNNAKLKGIVPDSDKQLSFL